MNPTFTKKQKQFRSRFSAAKYVTGFLSLVMLTLFVVSFSKRMKDTNDKRESVVRIPERTQRKQNTTHKVPIGSVAPPVAAEEEEIVVVPLDDFLSKLQKVTGKACTFQEDHYALPEDPTTTFQKFWVPPAYKQPGVNENRRTSNYAELERPLNSGGDNHGNTTTITTITANTTDDAKDDHGDDDGDGTTGIEGNSKRRENPLFSSNYYLWVYYGRSARHAEIFTGSFIPSRFTALEKSIAKLKTASPEERSSAVAEYNAFLLEGRRQGKLTLLAKLYTLPILSPGFCYYTGVWLENLVHQDDSFTYEDGLELVYSFQPQLKQIGYSYAWSKVVRLGIHDKTTLWERVNAEICPSRVRRSMKDYSECIHGVGRGILLEELNQVGTYPDVNSILFPKTYDYTPEMLERSLDRCTGAPTTQIEIICQGGVYKSWHQGRTDSLPLDCSTQQLGQLQCYRYQIRNVAGRDFESHLPPCAELPHGSDARYQCLTAAAWDFFSTFDSKRKQRKGWKEFGGRTPLTMCHRQAPLETKEGDSLAEDDFRACMEGAGIGLSTWLEGTNECSLLQFTDQFCRVEKNFEERQLTPLEQQGVKLCIERGVARTYEVAKDPDGWKKALMYPERSSSSS